MKAIVKEETFELDYQTIGKFSSFQGIKSNGIRFYEKR